MSGPAGTVEPIRLSGVGVRFGDRVALHDVDVSVREGEFVALTGPNGSGKTTLLRVLLGFEQPTVGIAQLFGAPVGGLSILERARRVAWVPQEESPRDNIPVFEYVLYGRYPHLRALEPERAEDRQRVAEVLVDVALSDRAEDGILELSGGERQRAILARALVQDAPVLLLDEPTSHLDIAHQLDLLERVRALTRRRRIAVLAALHDLNLAARFADRIVVLSRGRVVANGSARDVLSEELLARVWNVSAERRDDPRSGVPYLLPRRVIGAGAELPIAGFGPVHVIGGGGSAGPVLRALVDEGYRVTAGALHLLDTDSEIAQALGVPLAVEVPFAPLGAEARARNREFIEHAQAVVVAPFAVGPSNLANLEDLADLEASRPVYLLDAGSAAQRDFTGGRAVIALARLRAAGAVDVGGVRGLLDRLRELSGPSAGPPRAFAAGASVDPT